MKMATSVYDSGTAACVCVFVCMCMYVYLSIQTRSPPCMTAARQLMCVCACGYVYVCIYYIFLAAHVCVCVCMCMCKNTATSLWQSARAYIYIYIYIYIYTHTHTHTHKHKHIHAHTHTHTLLPHTFQAYVRRFQNFHTCSRDACWRACAGRMHAAPLQTFAPVVVCVYVCVFMWACTCAWIRVFCGPFTCACVYTYANTHLEAASLLSFSCVAMPSAAIGHVCMCIYYMGIYMRIDLCLEVLVHARVVYIYAHVDLKRLRT
jgi:hypothetical protein